MVKINKVIINDFNIINLCQKWPSYPLNNKDIPRGSSICTNPLVDSAHINIVTNESKTTLPLHVNSALGSRVIYEIQTQQQPWIVHLNEHISEPVVSIEFQGKGKPVEIPALLDTGSSVCVVSQEHLDIIVPNGEILPTDTACVGPDGQDLKCLGRIFLIFTLGTMKYGETFYILSTRCDSTVILGYPFMAKHCIKLVPGQYVTNSVGSVPLRVQHIKSRAIGHIKVLPCRDQHIDPHSVSSIDIRLETPPLYNPDHYKYAPWSVDIPGQNPQIALLNHKNILSIKIVNSSDMTIPAFDNDSNFGTAIPLVEFLASGQPSPPPYQPITRISTDDILNPADMASANILMVEDGLTADGCVLPDVLIPPQNRIEIDTTAQGFPVGDIGDEPCSECRAQGEKFYCNFSTPCSNLNNPWFNSQAPAKIDIMQDSVKNISHPHANPRPEILIHTSQCILDTFCRPRVKGVVLWCNSGPPPWFLMEYDSPSRSQVRFHTISPHRLGIVFAHFTNRMMSLDSSEIDDDRKMLGFVNGLILAHGARQLFMTCRCLLVSAQQGFINISRVISPGRCCPQGCRLSAREGGSVRQVQKTDNGFVASDRIGNSDQPDILTTDPQLVNRYKSIIAENADLFSTSAWDIGLYKDPETGIPYTFKYRLKPEATPYVAKFRPISPMKQKAAQEMIDSLLAAGIISRRVCPWIANSVWACKSKPILTKIQAQQRGVIWEGQIDEQAPISLRLTVSYVKLNTMLEFVPTPLPNIRKLFREMAESTVITVLDLTWSYYSLKICPVSSCMTGFWSGIPSDISLSFNRTPMGIAPSSGMLQAAVTLALGPVKKFVVNYSDNILIHSPAHIHTEVVADTFRLLRMHGLKVKKNKVHIGVTQRIKILGVVFDIRDKTVHPDPEKTRALSEMPYPASLSKLKSFLGAYQYMISTLHDSAQPIARLYALTRKSSEFKFDDQAKSDFDCLVRIALAPHNFIFLINYDLDIILRCDSSTDAVGWSILQFVPGVGETQGRYRSCGYGVKCFTAAQQRYGPSERELLGLVVSLKACESSIAGANVVVQMDCRGIILLTASADTNSKIGRYLNYILSFSPPIRFSWVAGRDKLFSVADMLSRSSHEVLPVVNRNVNADDEHGVEALAKIMPGGTATAVQFPVILDYLLTSGDHHSAEPGEIFISPSGHICSNQMKDGPCVSIIYRRTERPQQTGIPLTEADMDALGQTDDGGETSEFVRNVGTQSPDKTLWSDLVNTGTSHEFEQTLDYSSMEDRFLKYIITKFPLMDVQRLIDLQSKDSYFEKIINKCNTFQDLCWNKKQNIQFLLIRKILMRRFKCPLYGWSLSVCLPKVCVTDILIVMHRAATSAHLGVKRLTDKFQESFFSPHITAYAQMVVRNCFLCAANLNREKTTRGNYPHRVATTVSGPGIFWYGDVIQVISKHVSPTNSLLCFSDAFSGYIIAAPIQGHLTNEQFISLFEERVLTYFPQTKYVLVDNAQDISGHVVKQFLHTLNVRLLNSRPYSSKSNLVEGFQRLLVKAIRVGAQELSLPAQQWTKLLPSAIIALNTTSYQGLRFNICPHLVNFGSKPNFESLFTVNPTLLEESGYDGFVVKLAKCRHANTLAMLHYRRQKLANNLATQGPSDNKIQPGDLVFRHTRKAQSSNYKLRPRNTKLYLVLLTTSTSAYCREFSGGDPGTQLRTFQDFLDAPKTKNKKPLPMFSLEHFEVSDLVRVKNLVVLDADSRALVKDLDKLDFPGQITFELDEEEGVGGDSFDYDIDADDKVEESAENLDILGPEARSKIRTVSSSRGPVKTVSFALTTFWKDAEGGVTTRPLAQGKYTLQTPGFTSCI